MQSIIVRFTTSKHRTLLYENHKNIKSGARIRLDLTKDRYNLLVSARKRVNNCSASLMLKKYAPKPGKWSSQHLAI